MAFVRLAAARQPTLPTEAIDPTLPMDSTEPREPMGNNESVNHTSDGAGDGVDSSEEQVSRLPAVAVRAS
ncbi:hypothetical protein [Micromonospora matsumotoense]|uniref:hypothetical protein n=1 Tax=Micromonospora matsumotoense TaxID=121616 RepID=UPI0033E6E1DB